MDIGDWVIIVTKETVTGQSRPSFAKIIAQDGEKVLVESAYESLGQLINGNSKLTAKWITTKKCCKKIETDFMDLVKDVAVPDGEFQEGDLVQFVEQSLTGYDVVEGVVVNVTPKTLEIMRNGSLKIQRKKKSLVMRIV